MSEGYTTVKISRRALVIIRKYTSIHEMNATQFFDKLATLMTVGIDSLMSLDLEDLRKLYSYSDILIIQDSRKIFTPIKMVKVKKK